MDGLTFDTIDEFAFRRLARLLASSKPADGLDVLDFSIGEPKRQPPALLQQTLEAHSNLWNRYPPLPGTPGFRDAIVSWLNRRFGIDPGFLDPDRHVLPLAGTKEGIFLLPSSLGPSSADSRFVLMPDPVYSVYVGAAVLCGAQPVLLPALRDNGFLPDLDGIDAETLNSARLMYLCSPANPQGTVADKTYLHQALTLARRHNFLLALDECYSEIYFDEPPDGGLSVASGTGSLDNIVVFHSLSKRSNAAGLRSGFMAGDEAVLARFARMRAFGAAVQPLPVMHAAEALWRDEAHVEENREAYHKKRDLAASILSKKFEVTLPDGGFFLWLDVGDGVAFTENAWREAAVRTLPGAYLTSGADQDGKVGGRYVRLALVHEDALIEQGMNRLVAM